MSKHFEDARYYLGRAVDHAKEGVKEELEPVEAKVKELVGKEDEPELSRIESIKADLKVLEEKAEGEAREAVAAAREKLESYRAKEEAQKAE